MEKIIKVKQKILQLLDQFRIDNDGQKVTQWNMLALRGAVESELKKLEEEDEKLKENIKLKKEAKQ